jgi:peptide deformylase
MGPFLPWRAGWLYRSDSGRHTAPMTAQRILRMGNPVLAGRADEIIDLQSDSFKTLIIDMIDSMVAADGVGLAAPQIGVSQRVVIFCAPPEASDDGEGEGSPGAPGDPARDEIKVQPPTILINPEIEFLDDEQEMGIEGCLSVPGMCGPVPRFRRIRYTGLAPDGSRIDRTVEGFHARVVQHECDHLDGILYPQRMNDISRLAYVDEIQLLNEVESDDLAEVEG